MDIPRNDFKRAIAEGRQQIGLWVTLPSGFTAELLATCGYDWLLFDTEHSVGDPMTVFEQLQAAAPYPASLVVRPASNDVVLIKRLLDAGAQTLLIPYVQNANEAKAAVDAMRYAPRGVRGFAGLTRATRYGAVDDYATHAEKELCLLVQVETKSALDEIEAIAAVDGVDGIFVGPADLSASMGHSGNTGHPEVERAIEVAIERIRKAGKPAGILSLDKEFVRRCLDLGTVFTAVDVDASILVRQAREIAREFKG
ncbi:aldolase/citrate lyase family protein [Oricola cellulosilytica]|uniref:4-hydroxy-2-oxo-heptane-1,7-dioate aldolase n=1 Tax=Oricola cellulosilytica TaxID=1429082 RepID=A0A4V2MP75_9HYPH|nr:aldolase/citrate lyase family protein [Oricola cellulosilytica]TCD16692.1 4-hydroxy-2-oxo-heptane-1,7-dioate aldolase [Oricola cellulosilytica]